MPNLTLRSWQAKSYNEKSRTVDAILTTEAAATVFDRGSWEFVREILLMEGVIIPENGQVPLLDSHNSGSVRNILGSARDLRIEDKQLIGTVHFSDDNPGIAAEKKVRAGHITDLSIGYRVLEYADIGSGESQVVNGNSYSGPVRVVTSWELLEASLTPIGADKNSKIRSKIMPNTPQKKTDDTQSRPVSAEEAVRAERGRVAEITKICSILNLDEFQKRFIADGTSVEDAREIALNHHAKINPPIGAGRFFEPGETDGKKRTDALIDGMVQRAGFSLDKSAPGAETFRSYSLIDMARDVLENYCGLNTRGMSNSRLIEKAMLTRSGMHTTADFPFILANVGNKILRRAYEESPGTFQSWTSEAEAKDFKELSRVQLSEAPDLATVEEAEEYTYGTVGESREVYKVTKKGKLFRISWESLVNDDLDSFSRIAKAFVASAKRGLNKAVYDVIINNDDMSDGVALFHNATHGNLASSGGVLSIATLGAARLAMRTQTGLQGAVLNVRPQFLIIPAALETDADELLNTMEGFDASDGPGVRNPFYKKLTAVVDPVLDGDSDAKWYLSADPKEFDTIEVAYLDGMKTPFLDSEDGFETDSWTFKIRFVYGVKALDWRGLYLNEGQ